MATYIVRMLERPDEFCGEVREISTGTASLFVDQDELIAFLTAQRESAMRSTDPTPGTPWG